MENQDGKPNDIASQIQSGLAEGEAQRSQARFNHSLVMFEGGNSLTLNSDEFLYSFVEFLQSREVDDKEKKKACLRRLGEITTSDQQSLRERALVVFSLVSGWFTENGETETVFVIVDCLCSWLEYEPEFLPGFSVVTKRIEEIAVWLNEKGYWLDYEKLIVTLAQIQKDEGEKNNIIRGEIRRTLKNIAPEASIGVLINRFLLKDKNQENFKTILISLGADAVRCLLHRITETTREKDRDVLIHLIPEYDDSALQVLAEFLEKKSSFDVLKPLINIISERGNATHYDLILDYFGHQDKQIQHEMIRCTLRVGGEQMIPRLIGGLRVVDDSLKIHIIKTLAVCGGRDERVLEAFRQLASKRKSFSLQFDEELLTALVAALRNFPGDSTLELLKKIRKERSFLMMADDPVTFQINEVLYVMEPQLRHNKGHVEGPGDAVAFDSDPVVKQKALNKVRAIEDQLKSMISSGDVERAGDVVYKKALTAIKERDFMTAVLLGDRLLEINPMALPEAIELGDLIEDQKSEKVNNNHMEIWKPLYGEMSTRQFDGLYSILRPKFYSKGEILVRSGETDCSLYFIDSGNVGISYMSGGNEIFLEKMKPGSVVGGDQFFSTSVWTVILRALSEVSVHILEHQHFKTVDDEFPEVKSVLQRYCQKNERVPSLVKMSGDDRRVFPRYAVSFTTKHILLDQYGNKGKRSFKGELIDISEGGFSFSIRISNDNNARQLLGRQILTTLHIANELIPQCNGVIVGVKEYAPVDQGFAVHVKLSKRMSGTVIKKLVSKTLGFRPGS